MLKTKLIRRKLYCLPGTMCDERLWSDVERHLDPSTELIHIDIPMASSLRAMIDKIATVLPDEPVEMVGFSLGGYLASYFTAYNPERVSRLYVVSNSAQALPESELAQRKQALNWVSKRGYQGVPVKKAESMLGARSRRKRSLVQQIMSMADVLGEQAFVSQLSATMNRPCLIDELSASRVPIKAFIGMEDSLISMRQIRKLSQVENLNIYLTSDCGHMLPMEQPKWLASHLNKSS
ncbi:alpha/beta fold hydrolase [Marinomonas balearica]|uniref:Pimeloyl-ACP methyl ester carboxylesterase n=1 Tax=Marinomonas balearica TaxID=491947 RepID=A0A4R6M6D2_9GAMM|nr:alpha/beta hydrolase [Marinomonas balearica]TDO96938.1 pimeloyl-ACP methyl ester carboxylesterase [Marinomonas balearica]